MGRHSRFEQPDDEPTPGAGTPRGSYYGAPVDPTYDAFSGPTDDRVVVEPNDQARRGARPVADRRHDPPGPFRFEPLPGDYPGDYPGAPGTTLPEQPREPPDPPEQADTSGAPGAPAGRGWTRFVSVLPLPLLPIVALVIAVGIVSYALSTQQISLNFAGRLPRTTQTDPRDSQVSQRGPGERASRGDRPDGLVVAFRVASRAPGGFKATATIANKGRQPVAAWALAFKIPNATVTAVSGATVVRGGTTPFVRGRTAIAPGATVRIVFTARGTASTPSACVLNRLPCTLV
ncbi:cellulose binding domain-containing protein [Actinomadura madurae]|uniref:cellulose binding domain-containing protein n=1 Tax=Actinomadura madurae TaxID=1993 RepID=UPI0020D1F6B3|nr:cellulose binding domain-containing protein [Actinomadura madurae]MCP9954376.1 cellulose binding domain-containing protein [Actinomadura madurae]MCP9971127.1 cellulose binding domain-containing protein [Actinomadura madurae]